MAESSLREQRKLINFADSIIGNVSVYKTIDQTLGKRRINAGYSYSDLFRSYFLMVLCGGQCAEDINEHLQSVLSYLKGFEVCPADTLLRMQKELSTEKETTVYLGSQGFYFNGDRINALICCLYIIVYQCIRYLRELLAADFVVSKAKAAGVLKGRT